MEGLEQMLQTSLGDFCWSMMIRKTSGERFDILAVTCCSFFELGMLAADPERAGFTDPWVVPSLAGLDRGKGSRSGLNGELDKTKEYDPSIHTSEVVHWYRI